MMNEQFLSSWHCLACSCCSVLSLHFLTEEAGSQELTYVLTNVLDALRGFEWFSVQEKETHSSQHIVTLVHSSQTILTHST